MKNIALMGKPRIGKTTLVKKVLAQLLALRSGGFYTEEIIRGEQRVGFKIISLSGEEAVMAHTDFPGPARVGRYKVNVENLERVGRQALEAATRSADLIVIDEIGKMELFSFWLKYTILEALASPKRVLCTLGDRQIPFVAEILGRDDLKVFTVTRDNRNQLAEIILKELA